MARTIKIGIDIDGVLRDFGFQFARYAKEFYNKTLRPEDYEEFGFPNVTVNGRKIITDVFANNRAAEFVFGNAPRIENAKTGYDLFTKDPKFDIYVVSTQKKSHESISDMWLETHQFTNHIQTFYERDKLKAPVQIIIDDKVGNVKKFLENQRDAVLIDAPYNRGENREELLTGTHPAPLYADDLIDAYTKMKQKYK